MIKRMSALLLAAVAIATPALADPAAHPIAFERAGVHYVGTVTDRANGSKLIAGHEVESGRAFSLIVNGGMVNGVYNDEHVSYAAPRATSAKRTEVSVALANNTSGM